MLFRRAFKYKIDSIGAENSPEPSTASNDDKTPQTQTGSLETVFAPRFIHLHSRTICSQQLSYVYSVGLQWIRKILTFCAFAVVEPRVRLEQLLTVLYSTKGSISVESSIFVRWVCIRAYFKFTIRC